MIPFVPPPIRDESFYGLLSRIKALTGIGSDTAFQGSVFGKGARRRIATVASGLDLFASNLPPGCLWEPEEIAVRFTTAPFYSRFAVTLEVPGRVSRAYKRAETHPRASLKFCPECVVSDKKIHGLATWRRTHQFLMVTVCPWHLAPLRLSEVHKNTFEIRLCPQDPGDGVAAVQPFEGSLANRLADAALWLCENPGPPLPEMRQVVLATLLHARPEVLRNRSAAKVRVLADGLWAHAGLQGLRATGFTGGEPGVRRQLERAMTDTHKTVNPAFWCLLADFAGCHVRDFVQPDVVPRTSEKPAARVPRTKRPGAISPWEVRRPAKIVDHRAFYLETMRLNPTWNRVQCDRANPAARSFLDKYDHEWIGTLSFPGLPPKNTVPQAELAERVRAAAKALREEVGRPSRITATRIVNACFKTFGGPKIRLHHSLGELRCALEEEMEKPLSFGYRKIAWARETAPLFPVMAHWTDFRRIVGIPSLEAIGGAPYMTDLWAAYEEVMRRRREPIVARAVPDGRE